MVLAAEPHEEEDGLTRAIRVVEELELADTRAGMAAGTLGRAAGASQPQRLAAGGRLAYDPAMPDKFTRMTPELYAYLVAHNPAPDPVLRDLAEETAALGPISLMQVAVEQAAFLGWLTRLIGARRAVEVGTFTGYSAIAIARGLAPDGHLLCCDVNEEWAAIARRTSRGRRGRAHHAADRARARYPAFAAARSRDRRRVRRRGQGELRGVLRGAPARLRPNGVLVFDNVLWMGG